MKSITVTASEKRCTQVRFNDDGDLLFTAGSDGIVCVWRVTTGERLGTYHYVSDNPYNWTMADLHAELERPPKVTPCIDVNRKSSELAVCKFDCIHIFDVLSGKLLDCITETSKVQYVEFCQDPEQQNRLCAAVTKLGGANVEEAFKVYECADLNPPQKFKQERGWKCVTRITDFEGSPTVCVWGPLDQTIIGATSEGNLYVWALDGTCKAMRSAHQAEITCVSANACRSVILTVSVDKSAKLWNATDLSLIKEYVTDRPLNTCSIHPHFDSADETKRNPTFILAGGQQASEVTTSAAGKGFFELLIIDAISGEEANRLLAHYSPTLCVDHHPSGTIFATGAYEGLAKIFF